MASRLLSVESATAVKTVRKILTQFGDHGVVDVFKEYPPRDVVSAILALSRLQKASQYYAEEHQLIAKEFNDPELLEKLARYSVFAKAAYGWTMDLAMRARLHVGGDSKALLKETGIKEEDVIVASWKARTHRPVSIHGKTERLFWWICTISCCCGFFLRRIGLLPRARRKAQATGLEYTRNLVCT